MIAALGSKPYAASIVHPQSSSFGLSFWHFEPFLTPKAFNMFVVQFQPSRWSNAVTRRLPGLSSSPKWLPSGSSFQCLISNQFLQASVLTFELFQAFGLIGSHPTIFATPLVLRLFRYLKLPTDHANCVTLRCFHFGNPKLRYDLLGCMTFSSHCVSPLMNPNSNKILSSVVDSFSGAGHSISAPSLRQISFGKLQS